VRAALARLDRRALHAFRTRLHSPVLDRAAVAYTTTGEYGAIWIVAALAGAGLDSDRRGDWLAAAALVPAALTVNAVVKRVVRRRRPTLRGLPPIGRSPGTFSFPSGHAATSFAGAIAISALEPRLRTAVLAAAGLMTFTRPFLGVHYPSDVLVGAAVGTALGRAFASSR
jgi:membrane-associated phospholipid phosphatase